ncbi:3-oxoacyl-[acyl-carrier-protein] reductase domain protein [Ancylostoma duodenale]|uniref:3-oxoacyl-[acyl-carrier-protein] reductase domain protein n=1 Tax=Ancylostoma duodenale TaxID=51022 RepID=A0A0C2GA65_9BILA|nr:3-oxoacyl-[acyl-carrier-protein] reductase domain protein [Ancylostoma duodenale]
MKKTIDGTVQKFGRLDVLVNNAGGSISTKVEGNELDGDLSGFDYAMDLNTKSVLRLCQIALPHLIQTKGEIVNVGSIVGGRNGTTLGFPFYGISKAAQDQLTRNLAIHYISKGVRVNSVRHVRIDDDTEKDYS